MSDDETIERRLAAVERALTDGDQAVADLQDAAELADRVDAAESALADLEERVVELEAATQAVRGYVGNVRSVNRDVERRADAAVAAVDRLEARLDGTGDDGNNDGNDDHSLDGRGAGRGSHGSGHRRGPVRETGQARCRCPTCGRESPGREPGRDGGEPSPPNGAPSTARADGQGRRNRTDRAGARWDAGESDGRQPVDDPATHGADDGASVVERVRDALG